MLGAYLAYTVVSASGSFWVALVIVPILVAVLGGFVEKYLLRRIGSAGHAYELILTYGLFYMIGEAVLWLWGTFPLKVPAPEFLDRSVSLLGVIYPLYRLFILFASMVVCIVMAAILLRTKIGIIIRAAVGDGEMVGALGINVDFVRIGVFACGAGLAALAGVISAPFLQANITMAGTALIDIFAVVVLGGFGSLMGALAAALVIGQVQSFGAVFYPSLAGFLPFILMAVVLTARPQGFGGRAG
jgi:branched-chain amino acid transport system permease protein